MAGQQRMLAFLIAVVLISTAATVSAGLVAGGPGDPPLSTPPPPERPPPRPAGEVSEEEDAAIRATAEAESPGRLIAASGLETAGKTITFRDGRRVTLPEDAWIESRVSAIFCVEGQECPPLPYYVIQRWDSQAEVDATGRIWGEKVSSLDEDPFAFLREALQ